MVNSLRTSAGSPSVSCIEVFGRYAGFTAMLPTIGRCCKSLRDPEYKFNIKSPELLVADPAKIPAVTRSSWSRKGAMFEAANGLRK